MTGRLLWLGPENVNGARRPHISHVDVAFAIHGQRRDHAFQRRIAFAGFAPLRNELAFGVKDLDPVGIVDHVQFRIKALRFIDSLLFLIWIVANITNIILSNPEAQVTPLK
jgi:hypothetical protein